MTTIDLVTAGERLDVSCEVDRLTDVVREVGAEVTDREAPTLRIEIEDTRDPFPTEDLLPLSRGSFASRDAVVVVRDVATSGFDLRVDTGGDVPVLTYRWRPGAKTRAARAAYPSRHRLLARAVLVQFPALWRASLRGRTPVHAAACTAGDAVVLLAGPGGVGKTTLVMGEIAAGGSATGDNLAVTDGVCLWGLSEPLRSEGGSGRRMPHGRTESSMGARVARLAPDRIAILRRGGTDEAVIAQASPDEAARALIAGTYAARELQRFWSFAALLALGTGLGPAHPNVAETSEKLAAALPALTVTLPRYPGAGLAELLARAEAAA